MLIFENPIPAAHHHDRALFEVKTRINTYEAVEAAAQARLDAAPNDALAQTAWRDAHDRAAHWRRPEAVSKFAGMLAFFEQLGC